MKKLYVLLFILFSCLPIHAQTVVNAASCDQVDVQAAHDNFAGTDLLTIVVPACASDNGDWPGSLILTKGTLLQCDAAQNSIFLDNRTDNVPLIQFNMTNGRTYGIEHCVVLAGTNPSNRSLGILNLTGRNDAFFARNLYINARTQHYFLGGNVRGGIFNSRFIAPFAGGNGDNFGRCQNASEGWGSNTDDYSGEGSFESALNLGTADAFYLEGNYFEDLVGNTTIWDGYRGCRAVARYNTMINAEFGNHGTGDGTPAPGPAKIEIYNNNVTTNGNMGHQRGQWQIFAFNTVLTSSVGKYPPLTYYRSMARSCSQFGNPGIETWDQMDSTDTTGGDNKVAGDGIFWTGTATAGSGNLTLVAAGSPGWTNNQWRGYIVHVPTNSINPEGHFSVIITSNTSDTIIVDENNVPSNCPHTFVSGETFHIRRSLLLLDQIGAGQRSALLHGTVNGNANWVIPGQNPNQQYAPLYMFENVDEMDARVEMPVGADLLAAHSLAIREDEHFFTDNVQGAYDGSTGMGTGTCIDPMDERPESPALLRTGFWCTDLQELYIWDGDSWELYWAPYTYPHPLANSEGSIELALDSISPTFGAQGNTTSVTLTGIGFNGTDAGASTVVNVSKSGGSGLSTSMLSVDSDTEISVDLVATAGATAGIWNVSVTTDEGTTENAEAFEIIADAPTPTITLLSPANYKRGMLVKLKITGTDLDGGSPSISISGTGITQRDLTVVSATVITVNLLIANNATLGARNVSVTTSNGTSNVLTFTVLTQGNEGRFF